MGSTTAASAAPGAVRRSPQFEATDRSGDRRVLQLPELRRRRSDDRVIAPSDPPGGSGRRLSGYLSNDIVNLYFPNLTNSAYRTVPVLNDVGLTVGANSYVNNTGSVSISNGFAMEVTQDISTAATIAQGAAVNVYFTEITEQGLLVCLNRILLPEGESQPTVVTCSFNFWASDDTGQIGYASRFGLGRAPDVAALPGAGGVGVGVFMISQDRGSNDGDKDGSAHVSYPGSDPWVTSVGGTVIGTVEPGSSGDLRRRVWSNAGRPEPGRRLRRGRAAAGPARISRCLPTSPAPASRA